MEKRFIDNLIEKIKINKSYVCIGLDPILEGEYKIPQFLIDENYNDPNRTILKFNLEIIKATINLCVVYKPQIAYYEKYNALDALVKSIEYIHSLNGLVILDAKRNDIGSTSSAYAYSIFNNFKADATTINTYFGSDGIIPFLEYKSKGIFILLKTSNKSSGEFQDLLALYPKKDSSVKNIEMEFIKSDLYKSLSANQLNQIYKILENKFEFIPNYIALARNILPFIHRELDLIYCSNEIKYSNIGVVVGATYPKELKIIRKELPNSFFLIPGYGTQGGTAKDIIYAFNKDGLGAIINSSREIDYAYLKPINGKLYKPEEFAEATKEKTRIMKEEINTELQTEISLPFY